MGDPTGLGKLAEGVAKLADSEVGIRAYDDLLAGAMKEGGEALLDTVKAFRLFTAPIQLLALAQDRLARFCEQVRERVPEERQVEAPPSVALPVLMNLRYMEDENPLTELYLNLLARAIDKERQSEAHPAFVKIIEQMSPDEAMIVYALRERPYMCIVLDVQQHNSCPYELLAHPEHIHLYARHLASLNLLDAYAYGTSFVQVSDFGELFIRACVPEDFSVERRGHQEDSTEGKKEG